MPLPILTTSPCCSTESNTAASCCGDPTPVLETGACCSAPAGDCSCQRSAESAVNATALVAAPPVVVIGAGPVGLVAAAHLVAKGEAPLVLEAGPAVGSSLRDWGHVRLFSPWKYLVEPNSRALLETHGWQMPHEDRLPTGAEVLAELLEPLAALPEIAPHLRLNHRVRSVTKLGFDKVKSRGRDDAPFELVVDTPDGTVRVLARAVIDASGTWQSPNPMGAGGVLADGEDVHAGRIVYGIPDVMMRDRARYAGKRVLVVGSGHSAFNTLLELDQLKGSEPTTHIQWAVRRGDVGQMFGGGRKDALEARGALGDRLRRLVDSGAVQLTLGMRVARVRADDDGLVIEGDDGKTLEPVDEVIVTTGFRPNLDVTRELRLKVDAWLEAPEQLAPLIDPNLHSCGTVYPHGARELSHPEKNFFVAGMKSYGRAPTFLMLTGYEQVRSIACALTGDEAGARDVQLVLPETGVCQTDLVGAGGCC